METKQEALAWLFDYVEENVDRFGWSVRGDELPVSYLGFIKTGKDKQVRLEVNLCTNAVGYYLEFLGEMYSAHPVRQRNLYYRVGGLVERRTDARVVHMLTQLRSLLETT